MLHTTVRTLQKLFGRGFCSPYTAPVLRSVLKAKASWRTEGKLTNREYQRGQWKEMVKDISVSPFSKSLILKMTNPRFAQKLENPLHSMGLSSKSWSHTLRSSHENLRTRSVSYFPRNKSVLYIWTSTHNTVNLGHLPVEVRSPVPSQLWRNP